MVSYIGRFAPAVAVPLASSKGGAAATELTSSRSNTTNGDATAEPSDGLEPSTTPPYHPRFSGNWSQLVTTGFGSFRRFRGLS
ncbi:MAG: hypothetical protein LC777_03385, partial [Actinobacteria bacterium]|nr:hypothetical protein [Actinomycetota bacterium]